MTESRSRLSPAEDTLSAETRMRRTIPETIPGSSRIPTLLSRNDRSKMDSQLSWSRSRAACWGEGGRLALAEILHQPHQATREPLTMVPTSPRPATDSQSTAVSSSKPALSFFSHLPLSLRSKKNTRKRSISDFSSITTGHSFSPHSLYNSTRSQIIEHSMPPSFPIPNSPITSQGEIERLGRYQQQPRKIPHGCSFHSLGSPGSAPPPISESFLPVPSVSRSSSTRTKMPPESLLSRLIIGRHLERSSKPVSSNIDHGSWASKLAPFPCTRAAIEGVIKYRGNLLKYTAPSQTDHLIAPKSFKWWKSVFCCLTAIHPHNDLSLKVKPVLYTLHCFSTVDPSQFDTEQSRLRLESESIACVLEHAFAGESLILKVTGWQFDESCFEGREKEATWMFAMEGAQHLKAWMRIFKKTIADLKSAAPSPPPVPALPPQYRTNTHSFHSTSSARSRMTNINVALESDDTMSDWMPRPISTAPITLPSSSDFVPSYTRAPLPHHLHRHVPTTPTAEPILSVNLPELQKDQEFHNEEVSRNKEASIQTLRQDQAFLNPSVPVQTNRSLSSLSCSSHSSKVSKATPGSNSLVALCRPFLPRLHYPSSRGDPSETDTLSSPATSASRGSQRQKFPQIFPTKTGCWRSVDERTATGSFPDSPRSKPVHAAPSDVSPTSSPVDPGATLVWDRRTTLRLGPSLPAPTVALPPLPTPLENYHQDEDGKTSAETEMKIKEEGPLDRLVNEEQNAWSCI